jgi:hypothetical protein
VPYSIHRWLTDLEHTACGLRRPHAVRGWREVTCQRCLGSIHAKLAQWQRQPPEIPRAPHRDIRCDCIVFFLDTGRCREGDSVPFLVVAQKGQTVRSGDL